MNWRFYIVFIAQDSVEVAPFGGGGGSSLYLATKWPSLQEIT